MNNAIALSPLAMIFKKDGLGKLTEKLEHFRIKNHLRLTEKKLRAKDTSHLSDPLKKRREENLNRLNAYWKAGSFPQNLDFPNKRVPYFIDARGVPCAMAYLIAESGYKSLTKKVQNNNNHIYINDIKDGPVFEWIRESGLTQREAAEIQPTYNCHMLGTCPVKSFLEKNISWMWIALSAVLLIVLEWLAYKLSSWAFPKDKNKRRILLAYLSIFNLTISLSLGLIFLEILG